MMEKHLFSITFMLNCFVLILSFTGVISAPVQTITDIMKNDAKLCNASKFLYDSEYTKSCTTLEYFTTLSDLNRDTVNKFLCLGVYDAAYKICEYSSRLKTSFNSTASFNSYMESLVGDNQKQFCENLEGLTSLYNKTSSYLEPLIRSLNKPDKCQKICFDLNDHLEGQCAVLGWIRSIEHNIEKSNRNSIVSTQSISSSYDDLHNKTPGVNKVLKSKDIPELTGKQTTIDLQANSNKNIMQNRLDNVSSTNIKPHSEMKTSNHDESDKDKTQKTVDNAPMKAGKENIDDKTRSNVEAAQSNKNIPANNEVPSKNNAENNVPRNDNVNGGKSDDLKKKQNIDDAKTSTLSENTQDYDTNVEDEMENGAINDMTGIY